MLKHYSFRPVMLGDAEPVPLGDWTSNWKEAQMVLFQRGLAGYVHGIFVMMPLVTIEMESYYA